MAFKLSGSQKQDKTLPSPPIKIQPVFGVTSEPEIQREHWPHPEHETWPQSQSALTATRLYISKCQGERLL